MPTPRRPERKTSRGAPSPPRDQATGRFDHGAPPDPAQEARAAETLAKIAAHPIPPAYIHARAADTLAGIAVHRILDAYVDAAPDPEALAAQAEKYPDRWAQGLAIVGRLAGFSEKLEIEGSVDIPHLHRLSDLELEAEIAAPDATSE